MSLANYQYDAIIRQFNKKQLYNKHVADMRYQEVCNEIPAFINLDQKQANLALKYGQLMLNGNPDASALLEKELEIIAQERVQLLMANGYPKDYLDIKHDCKLCKDTGYTDENTQCICFKKAAVALLYDQSSKQDLYLKENFNTFSLRYYSDTKTDAITGKTMRAQAKEAFLHCKKFVDTIDTNHGNLVIYGKTGVGKSFLANCIAKALIDSVHSVIHLDAPSFFKVLADYHFRSSEEVIERTALYDCDCLIVDDLGAELVNSFVISSLCECIEHRRLNKKSTVFTTNLNQAKLKEQYEDRIFSRLISDYTFLRLDGDDIRLLKKNL